MHPPPFKGYFVSQAKGDEGWLKVKLVVHPQPMKKIINVDKFQQGYTISRIRLTDRIAGCAIDHSKWRFCRIVHPVNMGLLDYLKVMSSDLPTD